MRMDNQMEKNMDRDMETSFRDYTKHVLKAFGGCVYMVPLKKVGEGMYNMVVSQNKGTPI